MHVQRFLIRTVTNRPRGFRTLATALMAAILMALPLASTAGIYLSVNIAPPELPVYEQPPIPDDGYIWTPGYWAYSDDGYFWVPGTWVMAPYRGALWTPGYWGWVDGGDYAFHSGYWGDHVGFYGGVDYGYGYSGEGYQGSYWNGDRLYYNRSVNNINVTNVNVYNQTVINNTTINRVSYQGGPGGVAARPTRSDLRAAREKHTPPVATQQQQIAMASHNRALLASVNHGAPAIAATQRPGHFSGPGIVKARPVGPTARAAAQKSVQARPIGAPVSPVQGVHRRDIAHGDPNALRSAGFALGARADHAGAPGQANRAGTVANARHGGLAANTAHLANFAPQARAAARSVQPFARDAGTGNPRDRSRDLPNAPRSASFAPRSYDTRLMPPQRGSETGSLRGGDVRSEPPHFSSRSANHSDPRQAERNGTPLTRREMAPPQRQAYAPSYGDNRPSMPHNRDRPPEQRQALRAQPNYPSQHDTMPMRAAPYAAQGRAAPAQQRTSRSGQSRRSLGPHASVMHQVGSS
jgi:hypothetical protein